MKRLSPALVLTLILTGWGSGLTAAGEVFHLEFEAEAFDNVPGFGNWTVKKGLGWYGKAHIHAQGQGVAICDEYNVGAEMFKSLDTPLPAGPIKALVRVYKMRTGGANSIELAFGTRKDGAFERLAAAVFIWDDKTQGGYLWLGDTVTLPKPCDTIRAKALTVRRTGIGDNPEQQYHYIFFDRVYVTNDPRVKFEMKGQRPILTRPNEQQGARISDAQRHAEVWLKEKRPAPHLPTPGMGNLLMDSGFELGLDPWWFAPDLTDAFYLSEEDLDSKQKHSGERSLRLRLVPFHGHTGGVVCAPFFVKPATTYTLSFFAKANEPDVTFGVSLLSTKSGAYDARLFSTPNRRAGWTEVANGQGELGKGWTRQMVTLKTQPGQQVAYLDFSFHRKEGPATLWLDSVQFAEKPNADYATRRPIEIGIDSPQVARVHYLGKPLNFNLRTTSAEDKTQDFSVAYRIIDLYGQVQTKGTATVSLKGKGTSEQALTVPFNRRGSFLLIYGPTGIQHPEQVLSFCVVPDPAKGPHGPKDPFIGTISNLSDAANRVHERLGHDIIVTLEGGTFMPVIGSKLKEDGSVEYADDRVKSCLDHDMAVQGYIVPWTWGRESRTRWLRPLVYKCEWTGVSVLDLPFYAPYVEKVVGHYKGTVDRWILEDEADMRWAADEFAPWVRKLYQAAKKANPKATVVFSMTPLMFERIAKILGKPHNDVVAGSFQNCSRWYFGYVRDVMHTYKRPCWDIGVGWKSWPATAVYTPGVGDDPHYSNQAHLHVSRVTSNLFMQQAMVAPQMQSRYTSHLHAVHGWSFAEDDTYLPHSVAYVNMLQFLRGGKPGGILYLRDASRVQACYFLKAGKPCVMLERVDAFGEKHLEAAIKTTDVQVLDMDLNPVTTEGDSLRVVLRPHEPRIIQLTSDMDADAFLEALRQAKVTDQTWFRTLCLPGSEGLDFGVYMHNASSHPLTGVLNAGKDNLQHKGDNKRLVTLLPQKGVLTRFPLHESFCGNNNLGAVFDTFSFTDGKDLEWHNRVGWHAGRGLWACKSLPAKGKHAVRLDGRIDEWESQSGCYLYMAWAHDGSYGTRMGRYAAHRIKTQADCSATVWCRHDSRNLYIAVRVLDNDVRFAAAPQREGATGDQIRLLFDTELLDDMADARMSSDDMEMVLGPGLQQGKAHWMHDSKTTELKAHSYYHKQGWSAEVAIPWRLLGGRKPVMGFDVVAIDADGTLERKAEMAWSGADFAPHDPRGFGQLIPWEPKR